MSGIQCGFQTSRLFCLDTNHFNVRHQVFNKHRHPGGQSATADRYKDSVEPGILL